jgi:serine/threonine-protein kinase
MLRLRWLIVATAVAMVAAVVASVVALFAGGGGEVVLPVADWSLETAGGPVAVRLPARLTDAVPDAAPTFDLTARVSVPAALRGRPLTLGVAFSWARLVLLADGRPAPSVEHSFLGLERARGPYLYRIDPEASADGVLDLRLTTIRHRAVGTWHDVVPRLSAYPGGDPVYRAVRLWNDAVAGAALVGLLMVSLIYGMVWLFDRRNRTAALYALSSDFAVVAPLLALGIAGPPLGDWELVLFVAGFWTSGVVATHYLHATFELPLPHRALAFTVPLVVAVAIVIELATRTPVYLAVLIMVAGIPLAVHLVRLHHRARRQRRHRVTATLSMVAWGLFVLLLLPEGLIELGFGRYTHGLHTLSLGVMLYSMAQAAVVAYDRVATTRATRQLTDELRHQVAARSRQLADALARLGEAPRGADSIAAGDVIEGRYRVVRALGAGGMGAVYEVERLADGRVLALKVMAGAPTPSALARFAREAHIAAELDHPNLVPVFDVGVSRGGSMFLVMELVEGGSLEQQRARFGDVAWAVPLLAQVAAGLAAMHSRGMVHRDLKPANVLIDTTTPARARLADFGIASLGGDANAFAETAAASGPALTRPGAIMGTPAYMAPEMITGAGTVGPAVDVFAFGVVAYEALSGQRPFAVAPYVAHLGGQAAAPATPLPATVLLSPAVAAIVDACLALDPAARPGAAEVARVFAAV